MITIYDVLRRPLVTEKSNYQTGKLRQYSFEVAPDASCAIPVLLRIPFEVKLANVANLSHGDSLIR